LRVKSEMAPADHLVSAVLFDVGGVLVALDGMPSLARLIGGSTSPGALHQRWMESRSVRLHETGRISAEEFAAGVVSDLDLQISPEAFLDGFAAWLQGPHPGAFELVACIPRKYRVAALSNVSAFHWALINPGIPTRFERLYLSYETGYLKPAPEAFLTALDDLRLPASEVLFLDDAPANVGAARALGVNAHIVEGPAAARRVLEEYGVLPLA
jgi:FMN phosphatase YigB (HAD superfamily)